MATPPPIRPPSRLAALLTAARGRRVVVLGDLIADEFVSGRIARVSREAPVLILEYDSTEIRARRRRQRRQQRRRARRRRDAGGAGRTRRRRAAGCWRRARARVDTRARGAAGRVPHAGEDAHPGRRHPLGQAAGRAHRSPRRASRSPTPGAPRGCARRPRALRGADAVLVSDYGSGLLSPALVARLVAPLRSGAAAACRSWSIRATTCCATAASPPARPTSRKSSTRSASRSATARGRSSGPAARSSRARGWTRCSSRAAAAAWRCSSPARRRVHIPIYGSDEIADVTGAGDTVMATLTLALAAGASMRRAARLANYAGGLVVMKRGTATVSARRAGARGDGRRGRALGRSHG